MWVGSSPPLTWSWSLPDGARCSHAASGLVELVRVFGGRRLIFSGDSTARNEVVDVVGTAYGCKIPQVDHRSNGSLPAAWLADWALDASALAGGHAGGNSAAYAAFSAARADACAMVESRAAWSDYIFSLRLPTGGSAVALEF